MRKLAIALFIGTVLAAQLGAQTIVQSNQYQVTPGTGLNVNVGTGRVNCAGTETTYSGGTLSLGAWATDYVYLNTASGCVPAVKTSAFACGDIPLATVVTALSSLITITDARTSYGYPCAIGCSGVTAGSYTNANITVNSAGCVTAAENGSGGSGGSTRVISTSELLGTFGDAIVAKGSTTRGTDWGAAIKAALAGGNVDLLIDGQYGVGTGLPILVSSGTKIHCLPGMGLIEESAINKPMFQNTNQNAATTASGTGYGYLVSNTADHDIDIGGDGSCIFNVSGQSKTDSSNLWVTGMRLLGIQNLHVAGHIIDSAAYSVLYSNVDRASFGPLWCDHTAAAGNDDCLHGNGPYQHVEVNNLRCTNLGDDCLAHNADDGNETRFGDANSPHVQYPGFAQGPITDVVARHIYLENSANTVRLLSVTEPIDDVETDDVYGVSCNDQVTLYHEYSATYGLGDYRNIRFNGYNVNETGTCSNGREASFYVGGNMANLEIRGYTERDRLTNWPIVQFVDGTINNFKGPQWSISNLSGVDASYVYVSGTSFDNFSFPDLSWDDNASHVGTFFEGLAPNTVTVSNYAGPSTTRLFGSGFTPLNSNGDAFTNTYNTPSYGTTYLFSTFNEAASGVLTGTVPATCASGCTGTWLASNYSGHVNAWTYTTPGAVSTGVTGSGSSPEYINVGNANYTLRVTQLSAGSATSNQIYVRYTPNTLNFVTVISDTSGLTIIDVSGGVNTTVGTPTTVGCGTNLITIVTSGTTISAGCNGQTTTGSLPGGSANTSATYVGMVVAYNGDVWQLSSMRVSSL